MHSGKPGDRVGVPWEVGHSGSSPLPTAEQAFVLHEFCFQSILTPALYAQVCPWASAQLAGGCAGAIPQSLHRPLGFPVV